MTTANVLDGLRVLVVEDEAAIALLVEHMLETLGCQVVGSAATVSEALALVRNGGFDFVLLDRNLRGERVDPIALELESRGIPYAFASGYGSLPEKGSFTAQTLQKPFRLHDLERMLRQTLG
ncbi:MAG TPA: response regulator [Caulobacteraceae bacterium]|nr:response regulator [Caulobacteraceae bacterium]